MVGKKDNKKEKHPRNSSSKPATREESRKAESTTSPSQDQSETSRPSSTTQSSASAVLPGLLCLSKRDNPSASSSKQDSKAGAKKAPRMPSVAESSSRKEPPRIASVYPTEKYKSTSDNKKVSTTAGSTRPTTTQPSSSSMRSRAPSFARSIFKTTDDQKMASRQTKIESMSPQERKEQEKWAQSLIKGLCPGGVSWDRVQGGYRCAAKQHAVTDELVSEGKGGMFFLDIENLSGKLFSWSRLDWPNYFGPYYRDQKKKCFCGCGEALWRLGDVKGKPKYLPEEHTCSGTPVLKGMVCVNNGEKIPKEKLERLMKGGEAGNYR
ncbi:hypothetical protein BDZ45DRAFT_746207 [Acephala macrosclerotiorum]|nr:hypothetical protein BDZ45DRAFT_746207 [Acephala macrosclerotiorum]